jgi:hypothetical protein
LFQPRKIFAKSQETFDTFTDYKTILKLRKVRRLCAAGVFIELPTEEKFSFSNCVAIFFIVNHTNTRQYFQFGYYETFSDKDLKESDLKGYSPYGVYLFFKDKSFLESFKSTNKFII